MIQNHNSQKVEPNEEVFDLSRKADRDYINELKTQYMSGVNASDVEGNETDRALSSQLILVTTVLLTANIVVFGNKDLLQLLTYAHQACILMGLGCLITSIWLGIQYYQSIRQFHKEWGDARHAVVLAVISVKTGSSFEALNNKISTILNKLKPHIDEKNLKWQVHILKVALTIYLILAVCLIGNFTFITKHWSWYV